MRYRTFGDRLGTVSALTLRLDAANRGGNSTDWRDVVFAALEAGINSFEIGHTSPALLNGAAEAMAAVERRLFVVGWGAPLTQDTAHHARDMAAALGLKSLDMLTLALDRPLREPGVMEDLRRQEIARWFSVLGPANVLDEAIVRGEFDGMALQLDPAGGWNERNRIKAANSRGMGVIAKGVGLEISTDAAPPPRRGLLKLFTGRQRAQIAEAFRIDVPGWTDEQIAIAHTLTDPCISTIVVQPDSIPALEELTWCVERDLPAGAQAQIEMARFSASAELQPEQRRRAHR
jgi:hypothetical protein